MTGKVVRSKAGPVACRTKVGWVVSGKIGAGPPDLHCFETHILRTSVECKETSDALRQDLDKFWSVETIGSSSDCVVSQFENDIGHDRTRYVMKSPFKPDHEQRQDNFSVCEGRLTSLKRRLTSLKRRLTSKGILREYDTIFTEYEKTGIIERVPSHEIAGEVGGVHYLPHRPVVRDDKQTTKIRAVFDASCKVNGPSLNQCLYSGPNLIATIFDILVRFRLNKIGILADIKQAFLNIAISREHRDFVQFLWYDLNSKEEKLITYRFLRVVFGLTSSPFLLNAMLRHHLSKYVEKENAVVERIREDLYVDDLVSGGDSVGTAKEIYETSKAIMLEGGFELCKWVTNDPELQAYISSTMGDKPDSQPLGEDLTYVEVMSPNLVTPNQAVLGVAWDTITDEFVFQFDNFLSKCASLEQTKRNLLSASASIFDPLGVIAPITARIKTIFQLLCKDKLNWDDLIPPALASIWNKFLEELKSLREVRQPRFVFHLNFHSGIRFKLHRFCDSSKEVYSAVIYLRFVCSKSAKVSFLAAKTKVAPLKTITIPRLELLGCLLLSKLMRLYLVYEGV
jgi:hypothetical protein